MTRLVRRDVRDGIATVTLDSQHNRNALSRQLVGELLEELHHSDRDDDVKAVVVRAEGGTFCSGADLSEAGEGMEAAARVLVDLQRTIVTLGKPVVTRVAGNVRAGGIGIVAASDIAVTATEATYAFTEVRLGLAPAAISLTVLPRLTDRAAARSFLTGEVFDGATAAEMGLATAAVPQADLDAEVRRVCDSLVQGHPQGLRETKKLLSGPLVSRIDRDGDDLAALSARLFGSPEASAAMRAFLSRART